MNDYEVGFGSGSMRDDVGPEMVSHLKKCITILKEKNSTLEKQFSDLKEENRKLWNEVYSNPHKLALDGLKDRIRKLADSV